MLETLHCFGLTAAPDHILLEAEGKALGQVHHHLARLEADAAAAVAAAAGVSLRDDVGLSKKETKKTSISFFLLDLLLVHIPVVLDVALQLLPRHGRQRPWHF